MTPEEFRTAAHELVDWIADRLSLEHSVEGRWTEADEAPFRRMRVKVKKEIVTLGRPDIRPDRKTGKHVGIEEWNALISDPETLVIDTRNGYEFEVGTFTNAIDPKTDSFREFPDYARKLAEAEPDRKLAMFCTGGIRCEKATALMMELGFDEVYQLQGGILRYLEEVPDDENLWQGECFVFDQRVALNHRLEQGVHRLCHACGLPLTPEQRGLESYIRGVQCLHCVDRFTDADRQRFAERQRQLDQAKASGARS